MILSQSIIINRSAIEVFSYYADFRRHKEFIALLESTELLQTATAFGVGSEFIQRGEMLIGGTLEMHSRVTHFEPPRRVVSVSIDGGNEIEQEFEITPMDDNVCKAVYTTRVRPPKTLFGLAAGALSPFLKSKVKRQMEKDMQKFKVLLEAGYDAR